MHKARTHSRIGKINQNRNHDRNLDRNQTFQILTVIGIISVLIGHIDQDTFPLLNNWFPPYSYHMALFAFVSGYFYKDQNHAEWKRVKEYGKKKIVRLLLPAYLWNFLYGALVYILAFYGFTIGKKPNAYQLFLAPFTDGQQFAYNMASWFVVPLFLVEMIYVMIRYLLRKNTKISGEWIHFGIAFLFGMSGIYLVIQGHRVWYCLLFLKVTFFYVSYMLGRIYQLFLEKKDTCPNTIYFFILLIVQLLIHTNCNRLDYVLSEGTQFENGVWIPFLTAITGIAFYLRIAKILTPGLQKSSFLHILSKHSYSIMLHQFLGFMLVKGMIGVAQIVWGVFPEFSVSVMKTNIWYYYFPIGESTFGIVYFLGGIIIPVGIGVLQNKLVQMLRKKVGK